VRGLSRFGSSMSVLDFLHLGSSLSLRSFTRAGSAVSVRGLSRFGSSMSVLDFLHLGSSLSLRSFARVGSSLSVRGGVLSLSVRGLSRFGSSMSVLDFLHLGSSLSLRSFARVGSSISVYGNVLMNDGATIGVTATTKSISITSAGGTLHGTWSAENALDTSDRRLKKDIMPLGKTLAEKMLRVQANEASADDGSAGAVPDADEAQEATTADAVSWILRELRPVSFKFRRGPESKYARYGFVAQELARVLPQIVREIDGYHHVRYQDIVAVLTLTAQQQQNQLEALEKTVERERMERLALESRLQSLETLVLSYIPSTQTTQRV